MTEHQERLNLLFEMETIKAPLMQYISNGVSLRVIAELGAKDQNGNKKRFYEETRYRSNKYKNTDYLISASFRVNCYLAFEYPNPHYVKGINMMKTKMMQIKAYAIDDLAEKMKEFNAYFSKCFGLKKNKLYVKSGCVKDIVCYPTLKSSISFKPDVYEVPNENRNEMGVRIIFNDEYSIVVSAETTWPELLYKISRCDLTVIGFQMIQSYMSLLPGMAVSELDKNEYLSTARYTPYWEDPDDIINQPDAVKVSSNPITMNEKRKSFFES